MHHGHLLLLTQLTLSSSGHGFRFFLELSDRRVVRPGDHLVHRQLAQFDRKHFDTPQALEARDSPHQNNVLAVQAALIGSLFRRVGKDLEGGHP